MCSSLLYNSLNANLEPHLTILVYISMHLCVCSDTATKTALQYTGLLSKIAHYHMLKEHFDVGFIALSSFSSSVICITECPTQTIVGESKEISCKLNLYKFIAVQPPNLLLLPCALPSINFEIYKFQIEFCKIIEG